VTCYATEDAVLIGNWFYCGLTSRDYNYFLHCYTAYNQYTLIFPFCSERLVFTWRLPTAKLTVRVRVTLRLTVSQSVSLGVEPHLWLMTRYFHYRLTVTRYFHYRLTVRPCFCGAPSLTRGRVCLFMWCWSLPAQSFSGPSPLGLATSQSQSHIAADGQSVSQ
jgi:hypothetical protein